MGELSGGPKSRRIGAEIYEPMEDHPWKVAGCSGRERPSRWKTRSSLRSCATMRVIGRNPGIRASVLPLCSVTGTRSSMRTCTCFSHELNYWSYIDASHWSSSKVPNLVNHAMEFLLPRKTWSSIGTCPSLHPASFSFFTFSLFSANVM